MNQEISQMYSRLSAHEYALEIITAELLAATMPIAHAEKWLDDFKQKAHRVTVRDNVLLGDIEATRIIRDGVTFIEGFAEKVRLRLRQGRGNRPG